MKKALQTLAITFLVIFAIGVVIVTASDKILEARVDSVTQAITKNGNPYTRVIVIEDRRLQGVAYRSGTAVMFFGQLAEEGAKLSEGDVFKAVVNSRQYQGNTSYTVIKMIESPQ